MYHLISQLNNLLSQRYIVKNTSSYQKSSFFKRDNSIQNRWQSFYKDFWKNLISNRTQANRAKFIKSRRIFPFRNKSNIRCRVKLRERITYKKFWNCRDYISFHNIPTGFKKIQTKSVKIKTTICGNREQSIFYFWIEAGCNKETFLTS